MKQQQQQQAREMYFQTHLSKTEIAEKLGISRRSVFQWSVQGDWEKLRTSARCMPAMLAEKCYYLIGHFTDHLLSRESAYQSVTRADADILFKLTKTINLLKQGSTVNENMETFTFFLDGLQKTDPDLAQALLPHADDFISSRAAVSPANNMLSHYTADGFKSSFEKEVKEKWHDEQDAEALRQAMQSERNNTGDTQAASGQETKDINKENTRPAAPNFRHDAIMHNSAATAKDSDKDKNRKTIFWENIAKEKARKEAARHPKAA